MLCKECQLEVKNAIKILKKEFMNRTFFAYNPDVEKSSSMKIINKIFSEVV